MIEKAAAGPTVRRILLTLMLLIPLVTVVSATGSAQPVPGNRLVDRPDVGAGDHSDKWRLKYHENFSRPLGGRTPLGS